MQRTHISRVALVVSALLSWPAIAHENRLSFGIGAFGGGHFFDGGTNLGVASEPGASDGARSNGMLGLRASLMVGRWAAVEAEGFATMTSDRTYDLKATILGYRLNALLFPMSGDVRPFFLVGGGVIEVIDTYAVGAQGMVRDRDGEFHLGAGLDLQLLDHLSVRADVRMVEMPAKPPWSFAADFEATLGMALSFGVGSRAQAASEPAEAPPAPAPVVAAPAAPVVATPAPPAPAPPPPPAQTARPTAVGVPPAPSVPAASVASSAKAKVDAVATPPDSQRPSVQALLGRAGELRFKGASSRISFVSLPFIGQLAETLVKNPSVQLEIVSHTAASGNAKKDLGLSRRRAEAVKKALVEREVDGSRLTAVGRGSQEPLAPNITKKGRRMNDRVELRLLSPESR